LTPARCGVVHAKALSFGAKFCDSTENGWFAMKSLLVAFVYGMTVAISVAMSAAAFQTTALSAIVIDHGTGIDLMEKNADVRIQPASMSKLMTLYMLFEALDEGRLTLDDKLPVSSHAMSFKGSSMFLNRNDRVRVEDLIRGIVVLSGNDACVVVAEALSPDGSADGFAQLMTQRGREIGLEDSNFKNSNGWPDADHYMTARDLGVLTRGLLERFPHYYHYFSEQEFGFDERVPSNRYNRNPLLKLGIGADGLKTGYTNDSGYGLVGSAKRGKRRVVFVLAGMSTLEERREEAERLVTWYSFQFEDLTAFKEGEEVIQSPVAGGKALTIPLTVREDVTLPIPTAAEDAPAAGEELDNVPHAPIQAGDVLGTLVVHIPGLPQPARIDLIAKQDVPEATFIDALRNAALILLERYVVAPISDVL